MIKNNKNEMHIVIGCMHLPFHNKKFFNSFLNLIKDLKGNISGIHLIGDILDMHSISSHDKGKINNTGMTLNDEYIEASVCLSDLDYALGNNNIKKNFLYGNHEERIIREMQLIDNSKYGKALLSPIEGCRLVERGYTIIDNYKDGYIQLGKLNLIHGEYTSTNHCKKHLDTFKSSVMYVHTHKVAMLHDGDRTAYNIGWMGNSNAPVFSYASRGAKMNWQNGFAIVIIDNKGDFHVNQIIWKNEKFFYGEKQY